MPREFSRSERMAEQLRRELADIVRDEIKDPRLGFVSFTEVRMSRDLSHAVIYCSVLNSEDQAEAIEILNRAVGFIRKEIARRIRARIVPTLKFAIDDSVMRGAAMDSLISKAIEKDNRRDDMDDDKASDDSEIESD
jgi:ribosome-binding factor A